MASWANTLPGARIVKTPPGPAVQSPLALTAEMKSWLRQLGLSSREGADRNLRRLAAALIGSKELALKESSETLSAAETFRQGQGNCVSFALLFVALAREVGEPAYFALSDGIESSRIEGDLRVAERHLVAAFGPKNAMSIFDFGGIAENGRGFRPISDATARAVFLSNRGVEMLMANRISEASGFLLAALELDVELPIAWLNLGVALRRGGDTSGARAAFRQSVRLDPESLGAWRNLALLLDEGRSRNEPATLLTAKPQKDSHPRPDTLRHRLP